MVTILLYFSLLYFISGPRVLTSLFYHGNGFSKVERLFFCFSCAACEFFGLNKLSSSSSSVLLSNNFASTVSVYDAN